MVSQAVRKDDARPSTHDKYTAVRVCPVNSDPCSRRTDAKNSIKVKQIKSSYNVEQVFNVDIPALQHGNDGLIYTCVNTPYTPGTDPNM